MCIQQAGKFAATSDVIVAASSSLQTAWSASASASWSEGSSGSEELPLESIGHSGGDGGDGGQQEPERGPELYSDEMFSGSSGYSGDSGNDEEEHYRFVEGSGDRKRRLDAVVDPGNASASDVGCQDVRGERHRSFSSGPHDVGPSQPVSFHIVMLTRAGHSMLMGRLCVHSPGRAGSCLLRWMRRQRQFK